MTATIVYMLLLSDTKRKATVVAIEMSCGSMTLTCSKSNSKQARGVLRSQAVPIHDIMGRTTMILIGEQAVEYGLVDTS